MADTAIEVHELHKSFGGKPALRGVSFAVARGEMVALLGASGSGKSTLLRHLSGLHRADAETPSRIVLLGREVQAGGRLSGDVRAVRARVSMIFQQFNLVDRLPVITNVLAGALHRLPLWRSLLARFPLDERQRAIDALRSVGIEACAQQRASTLSGGQQQRAAIARALLQGAEMILADEPIASLDPESSGRVMKLLARINRERGVTVLVSLHQVEYAFACCPRTIALRDGRVVYDGPTAELTTDRLRQLYGQQFDELVRAPEQETADRPVLPGMHPSLHPSLQPSLRAAA